MNKKSYSHFISVGYFCSVAMELERYGFRSASYPFDWLVTPRFDQVIRAIDTHFEDFLDYNALRQDTVKRQIYYDNCYHCSFVHDFNKYTSLTKQLPAVSEKYNRRIDRFYRDIAEPTLFIRYINDEDDFSELHWIEDHIDYILFIIRKYNPDNDILWIANKGVTSEHIRIYNVERDPNDNVARRPFESNSELGRLIDSFELPNREENLRRYLDKKRREKHLAHRLRLKLVNGIKSVFMHEYIHTYAPYNEKQNT